MKKEIVHNVVHDHRTDSDVTQQGLADAVGVSRQTIIAIERGNYVPSVALALKISQYFDVSVEELFILQYE